jgi:transient receptor potential cation channel subfamily V protein 6
LKKTRENFILFLGFGGFLLSVKQSFLGMLGDFDLDAYTDTRFSYISVTLLVIYIIVVTILLLNLLIAMMGDTYGNIIEGATQIW